MDSAFSKRLGSHALRSQSSHVLPGRPVWDSLEFKLEMTRNFLPDIGLRDASVFCWFVSSKLACSELSVQREHLHRSSLPGSDGQRPPGCRGSSTPGTCPPAVRERGHFLLVPCEVLCPRYTRCGARQEASHLPTRMRYDHRRLQRRSLRVTGAHGSRKSLIGAQLGLDHRSFRFKGLATTSRSHFFHVKLYVATTIRPRF